MDDKCRTCTIKCRQADHIHETALGRMYALNELLSYIKRVDSGELVEVVHCKDCKYSERDHTLDGGGDEYYYCWNCEMEHGQARPNDFCSYGERRNNA